MVEHAEKLRAANEELVEEMNCRLRLEAKILAVSDVVEATSFPRPYRQHAGLESALNEISQNSGILYDFNVVHACLAVFNEQGIYAA